MRHYYILWFFVLLLGAATVFSTVEVVNLISHNNDALSAIVCHAEHLIRVTKGITPHQKHQALHFYQQQIGLEHLKPCKEGN